MQLWSSCNYVTNLHAKVGCKSLVIKTRLRPVDATPSNIGHMSDLHLDYSSYARRKDKP